ncbi:MAG: hypothetical protein ABJN69_09615, partial [Hellea sp.]
MANFTIVIFENSQNNKKSFKFNDLIFLDKKTSNGHLEFVAGNNLSPETQRERKKMTFSTFDIDAGTASESGASVFETSNPARHTRSRRHSAL